VERNTKQTQSERAAAAGESNGATRRPLLELQGLATHFFVEEGVSKAVDGVDYAINSGETLGVVGESGSGKSVTALSIMRLIQSPPGRIVSGRILFEGHDLLQYSEERMRELRGNEISMIFQEPMTALNPVFTVGDQIAEAVRLHQKKTKAESRERAIEMLERVGIPSPRDRIDNYPHEMSGGMRQRVMIAMAMSCNPKLLIADEPTTALDVTIQAQILEIMRELQESAGMSMLLITHSLGVVAENAHHVAVMYAGKVVEYARSIDLFDRPRHPYTIGLLASLPELAKPGERLRTIPGIVPSAFAFPSGCRFRTRCPIATERCTREVPPLANIARAGEPVHTVACHHLEEALKL
jgi:oligopeptide/dipeptide ABC transporter ATP-binding protein